jgi:hypothetical protein
MIAMQVKGQDLPLQAENTIQLLTQTHAKQRGQAVKKKPAMSTPSMALQSPNHMAGQRGKPRSSWKNFLIVLLVIAAIVPYGSAVNHSRKIGKRRKRYNKRARRKHKPSRLVMRKKPPSPSTTKLVVVHFNIATAPSNMAAHYAMLHCLDAQIAMLTETKLHAPAAMYPPPESFGWQPTHIHARASSPHAGTLTGSNSGGVTILIRQDLGIMPTDMEVINEFYAQTLIIHPPMWQLPLQIVASYIPSIGPSTDESIFLSILTFILSISQIAAVMMIWAGDFNFRSGDTHDASHNSKIRNLERVADYPADERSQPI